MLRYSRHASLRIREWGVTEEEVRVTIDSGEPFPAKGLRLGKARVFRMGYERQGRPYPHKEVRVIFALEAEDTIVVTVVARYGRWEDSK